MAVTVMRFESDWLLRWLVKPIFTLTCFQHLLWFLSNTGRRGVLFRCVVVFWFCMCVSRMRVTHIHTLHVRLIPHHLFAFRRSLLQSALTNTPLRIWACILISMATAWEVTEMLSMGCPPVPLRDILLGSQNGVVVLEWERTGQVEFLRGGLFNF